MVPALDEALRLPALVEALVAVFEDGWELVIVDDGSTDATAAVAEALLARSGLDGAVVGLETNMGKGAALRAGVARSTGAVVVTMDADMATDLADLGALVAALGDHDIAIGSRCAPGAEVIDESRLRRFGARVFNLVVRALTGLRVADTQCGFKAFEGGLARRVFAVSRADRWGHDVEVLDLARRGGASIVEVPVRWRAMEGSKVRVGRDAVRTLLELGAHLVRRRAVLRDLHAPGATT